RCACAITSANYPAALLLENEPNAQARDCMSRKPRRQKPSRRDITIHRRTPPGASPGQVIADPSHPKPTIHVTAFDEAGVTDQDVPDPAAARALVGRHAL